MKKRIVWMLVIALVCVGGFFGYRYVSRRNAFRATMQQGQQNQAQARVERRDLEIDVVGKGTVAANQKKTVTAGVAGTISGLPVKEGDVVRAGDPVVYLSSAASSYQADQARLDLALAQQTLANLTGPAGAYKKAELDVKSAETNLKAASDKVDDLRITSPIAGEVWDVAVKEGDSVKAGQVIATIGDTSSFIVAVSIKQADVTRFRTGVAVSILPGGDLPLMGGVLTYIGKEGSAGTKGIEFPAEVTISKPDPRLRPGMTINVNYTDDEGNIYTIAGTTGARDRKDVKAEVDGTVVTLGAAEGDFVAKDTVLVVMENDSLLVAKEQAETALESARQSLESYQSTIDSQVLKVESARIAYEERLEALSKLVVKSPIDGKVLSCSLQFGDEVTAAQSLLTIGEVEPLVVAIPVDELDVINVAVGQPVTIEVDAIGGEIFTGRVQKIAQEGTVQQGITNYTVTVELDSTTPLLGMSATATIAIAQKTQVLTVPVEAITWNDGQAYVNMMENGQATQKRVKVGVQGDLYAEIVSGLAEGDSILTGNSGSSNGFGIGGFGIGTRIQGGSVPSGGPR